jgi:hypothetical protein
MNGLRMTPRGLALALFLLAAAGVANAQAVATSDLTGKWSFTVTTDNGTGTPTVTLKQQGDSLSGNYSSQVFGEQPIKGAVTGNKITFKFSAAVQDQSLTVTYLGTIEPDGSLKGTLDLGGFGSGTFTAKKQTP